MARIHSPGVVEVWLVDTITDTTNPSAAELDAGTDLTSFCRGVPTIPETGNTADISNLSSKFNARQGASYGGDTLALECYRDDTTDTAYTTLTRAKQSHLVVAWDGLATSGDWAAADVAWIYPVTIISRGQGTPGRDEVQFFVSQMAITADPDEGVTCAA